MSLIICLRVGIRLKKSNILLHYPFKFGSISISDLFPYGLPFPLTCPYPRPVLSHLRHGLVMSFRRIALPSHPSAFIFFDVRMLPILNCIEFFIYMEGMSRSIFKRTKNADANLFNLHSRFEIC